jgi:quercetin dioxygenase-like cupin family protein
MSSLCVRHIPDGKGEILSAFGDSGQVKLTTEDTGGNFEIHLLLPPRGVGPPLHVHTREDEAFIVKEGRFRFYVDGTIIEAGEGDVVFGPRNIPHTFQAIGEGRNAMWLLVAPSGFGKFFRECVDAFNGDPAVLPQKIKEASGQSGIEIIGPPMSEMPDIPPTA